MHVLAAVLSKPVVNDAIEASQEYYVPHIEYTCKCGTRLKHWPAHTCSYVCMQILLASIGVLIIRSESMPAWGSSVSFLWQDTKSEESWENIDGIAVIYGKDEVMYSKSTAFQVSPLWPCSCGTDSPSYVVLTIPLCYYSDSVLVISFFNVGTHCCIINMRQR